MEKDKDSITLCEKLIRLDLETWPDTQAIYLFGSWSTKYERPESDADIAVLLLRRMQKGGFFGVERFASCIANIIK